MSSSKKGNMIACFCDFELRYDNFLNRQSYFHNVLFHVTFYVIASENDIILKDRIEEECKFIADTYATQRYKVISLIRKSRRQFFVHCDIICTGPITKHIKG